MSVTCLHRREETEASIYKVTCLHRRIYPVSIQFLTVPDKRRNRSLYLCIYKGNSNNFLNSQIESKFVNLKYLNSHC